MAENKILQECSDIDSNIEKKSVNPNRKQRSEVSSSSSLSYHALLKNSNRDLLYRKIKTNKNLSNLLDKYFQNTSGSGE